MTPLRYALLSVCLTITLQTANVHGQLTRYYEIREWSDSSGKFSETAKLISSDGDTVVLKNDSGKNKNIPVDRLSIKDQEFVKKFVKATFANLKSQAKDCLFAADALKHYRDYQKHGLVSTAHRLEIESRIEVLESQTKFEAVIVGDGFLPKSQLKETKETTKQQIKDWIAEANNQFTIKQDVADDQKLLRSAIRDDPTSIDGLILLSLLLEVKEANYSAAQRHLEIAVRQGTRYLPISTEDEKSNLQIAMNNLGVSYARSNRLAKAHRIWTRSLEMSNAFGSLIEQNLAKASQMADNQRSGISANASTRRDLRSYLSFGSSGGWKLMCPIAFDGNHWTDIRFILVGKFSTLTGQTIEDHRCVKCNGTSVIRCLNNLCQNGVIKKDIHGRKVIPTPQGPRDGGYGLLRVEHHKCPTCRGDGRHKCPCCTGGRQN